MNVILNEQQRKSEQQIRNHARASFTGESVPELSEEQLTAIIDLARARLR